MFNFKLTKHAIDRTKERFPHFCENMEILKNWKQNNGLKEIYPLFSELLKNSNENKSFINNTKYMVHLYEKYGFDIDHKFLENKEKNMTFVMVKNRNEEKFSLVTVVPINFRPTLNHKKYSNKKTKEEIKKDNVLYYHTKYNESIQNFVKYEEDKIENKLKEFVDMEYQINTMVKNKQYKLLKENKFYIKKDEEICIFDFNDKNEINFDNLKKYELFDKNNNLEEDCKKMFINDYLNDNKSINHKFYISKKVLICKYSFKNEIYHIVFIKNKEKNGQIKKLNPELSFLLNV